MRASNLRGRGGAGFPTGTKWNLAAAAGCATAARSTSSATPTKGEPGTFKDRVLLTDYADLVFEGMTIAARAIGATKGILYLRGEYVYLRPHLDAVLARAAQGRAARHGRPRHAGFDFDIEIRMGAGAYVCGEETALIESLEGHRGEPRNRPPFPVDTGFLGQPTVVNNVETLASVTRDPRRRARRGSRRSAPRSRPASSCSASPATAPQPGVYEFPLGITVAELLEKVGGAGAKAVQIGGASGTCVPASEFGRKIALRGRRHRRLDHRLRPGARHARTWRRTSWSSSSRSRAASARPAATGNAKLLEGIEMLEHGACSTAYLRELLALCETMQLASKCGLGQSSPNAFVSIVKHFQDEILGRTAAGPARSPPAGA